MVAVMVTLPVSVGLRVFPLMVAEPLTTDQPIVWLVALEGDTVPVKVKGVPTITDVGTSVIPDTATKVVPLPTVVVLSPDSSGEEQAENTNIM